MWFEDEELLGRRLMWKHKKKKKPVLRLKVRLNVRNKAVQQRFAVFVLVPFIIAAAAVICWYGFGVARKLLFTENEMFAMRNLEIVVDSDAVVTPGLIREHAGLESGMNLFKIPIGKIRAEFLENMPNIKMMKISRHLPDTLRIKIIEREPIARFGRTGGLVVDNEGWLFVGRRDLSSLPVIYGYRGERMMPGDKVEGMAFAAVQILDACSDPDFDIIKVKSVDVGGSEFVNLWLAGGKSPTLLWKDMGEDTEKSRKALVGKLIKLARILESDEGRGKHRFDMTFDHDVYAE